VRHQAHIPRPAAVRRPFLFPRFEIFGKFSATFSRAELFYSQKQKTRRNLSMNIRQKFLSLALCAAVSCACVGAAAADTAEPVLIAANPRAYTVTISGKSVSWSSYEKNNRVMVPLRAAGTALGFTVVWDKTAHAAKITNADYALLVYPGTDSYVRTANNGSIGATAPASYGAKCEIKNGTMYVPVRLFELLGDTVTVKNHQVNVVVSDSAQIPNPIVTYDTVDAAKKAVKFAVKLPAAYPDVESVSVIAGDLFQIDCKGGICYREAMKDQGDDISGDYNVYDAKTVAAGKLSVTLKSDKTGVRLAIWNDGVNSFSLSWETAVTQDAAVAAVLSVA
jgi:hypothetical protein